MTEVLAEPLDRPSWQHVKRVARGSGVAVAIATYNHAHFLGDALDSVMAQSLPADEVIVVDDGSEDDPGAVVSRYPGVRLIRQANQGLSAARNAALDLATADRILFLDADDVLAPTAVEANVACFDAHPESGFVYGGHLRVDASLEPVGTARYSPIGSTPRLSLLKGNAVGMHATVLYDRARLQAAGGFDTSLRRCEDYDVYLRMARHHPVASHSGVVACYRIHGSNMSGDIRAMLRWIEHVHDLDRRRGLGTEPERRAWAIGRQVWRDYYADQILASGENITRLQRAGSLMRATRMSPKHVTRRLLRRLARQLPEPVERLVGVRGHRHLGMVRLGDLDRVDPVSRDFGFDRGTPVDRHYIAEFLAASSGDIRGRALEVGDASYCERFGTGVTDQDVLHVSPDAPHATITGDISAPGTLPEAAFDCMVLTQTLHLIYDLNAAVAEIHRALKPGGILLLTVPGISQIDRGEWGDTWYWSLTRASATRLFAARFGGENVTVGQHGNVYAATCFLNGLALEEVDRSKLDVVDPSYPVVVTVRARRAAAG